VVIERDYRTADPHPKLKGPDGLPARFNGSAFNLPTYKNFLLSLDKLGHSLEVEREALDKLVEATARLRADQIFQIRIQNNEPVAVFRRTAGSLVGKLSEEAGVYIPSPGVTVMNREKLAEHIAALREAKIDTGLEEVVLKTLDHAVMLFSNPEMMAKAIEEEQKRMKAEQEETAKAATAPQPVTPVPVSQEDALPQPAAPAKKPTGPT
jgi:hypothetical protein